MWTLRCFNTWVHRCSLSWFDPLSPRHPWLVFWLVRPHKVSNKVSKYMLYIHSTWKIITDYYHFFGWVNCLYFLYLIFHSIIALHRTQTPDISRVLSDFVWWLESCKSLRNFVLFWYFGGPAFCAFPLCVLISHTSRRVTYKTSITIYLITFTHFHAINFLSIHCIKLTAGYETVKSEK